jgi:hypothetical protein
LSSPELITGAAEILSTEARQSTWIDSTVRGLNPWSTEFEVLAFQFLSVRLGTYVHEY